MDRSKEKLVVHVCWAKKCTRRGAAELAERLGTGFKEQGVHAIISRHDCFDMCKQGCNLLLDLPGHEQRIYTQLHPSQAEAFAQHIADELKQDSPKKEDSAVPG